MFFLALCQLSQWSSCTLKNQLPLVLGKEREFRVRVPSLALQSIYVHILKYDLIF